MLESLVSLPEAQMLEWLPAAAIVLDAAGALMAFNRRAISLLGRSPSRGDPFKRYCTFRWQTSHTPDSGEAMCPLDRCLQTGEPLEGEEAVVYRTAGLPLPICISLQPVRDAHGDLVGAVGILRPSEAAPRDSTSPSTAGAPVSRADERFRALIEQGHDGISLIDAQGILLYTSPSVTRLLGYTQEEVLGMDTLKLVHPDDQPAVARALLEVAQVAGSSAAARARLRHQDGTWRHFSISGTNRLNEPSVAAIILNYSDTTASYLAERRLEEASALLRQVTESLDDVCWVLDPKEQRIIYVSPAYERVWGWPADELYRTREAWLRTVHPDDRKHALQDTNEDDLHQGVVRSYRIIRPDGDVRWIRDRSRPLLDASGQVYRWWASLRM
ncbi:MAG TPA: PAS domain S-box protein [Armatimonadota bacterium]